MTQPVVHGEVERDVVQTQRAVRSPSLRRRLALMAVAALAAMSGRDDSAADILIRGTCTGCCAA